MTDAEARALGLRAVACQGWGWRPGMLAISGGPDEWHRLTDAWAGPSDVTPDNVPSGAWPDLRDPATLGAFVDVVHRRVPGAWAQPGSGAPDAVWYIRVWRGVGHVTIGDGDTEAEAWVLALGSA